MITPTSTDLTNGQPATGSIRKKGENDIRSTGNAAVALDRYLLESGETSGAIAVVEHRLARGVIAAPVHRHTREDEYSIVLQGRLGVFQDGDELVAEVGELVLKPRRRWHTFWNAGDEQLRILELIVPGGLEVLFQTLAGMGETYDPESLPALAHRYGCQVDFDRTEPLIARHGLHF